MNKAAIKDATMAALAAQPRIQARLQAQSGRAYLQGLIEHDKHARFQSPQFSTLLDSAILCQIGRRMSGQQWLNYLATLNL